MNKFIVIFLFLTIAMFSQETVQKNNQSEIIAPTNLLNDYNYSNSILKLRTAYRQINLKDKFIPQEIKAKNFIEINSHFVDSEMFYIVIGSAIALGASAAYFKLESDKYYDKYNSTGNKTYLNKTDKFDIYSGIALGALQINFGYMIYRLLTD